MSQVIIVDDQSLNRRVLARLAASLEDDISVRAFSDPLEALSYARDNAPDLLITDFKMPVIDGAELIRRFRSLAECREVPAMVVSASRNDRFRTLALEAGANEFILSPLNHDEFRTQSRKLLEMRRLGARPDPFTLTDNGAPGHQGDWVDQIQILNGLVENLSSRLLNRTEALARLWLEVEVLLGALGLSMVLVDEHLNIHYFTRSMSTIYDIDKYSIGCSIAESLGRNIYHCISNDLVQVMKTGEIFKRIITSPKNSERYHLDIIPTRENYEKPKGAILVFRWAPSNTGPRKSLTSH